MNTRLERDSLGEQEVPKDAWYGIQTQRAMQNFNITGVPISHYPDLIKALAMVKSAAARANKELGLLENVKANAIIKACDNIIAGQYLEQFQVDMIQGGAGTSTNMNANEVIANVALHKMGYAKGNYQKLHPNNDVNCSQSTNDAYPTAVRLGIIFSADPLLKAIDGLRQTLDKKAHEFSGVIKVGRTQLQDAVPMTLGQEFGAFAENLDEDRYRIKEACKLLCEVNFGGTAIGTGINTHSDYARMAIAHLVHISGRPMTRSKNLIEATSDMGAFVYFSGILKRLAVKLSKLCNDLRLLSSGPKAGLGEIRLPAVQPGSSIMPGKVNPVIPEAVNQTAFQVIGNDIAVTMASEAGQLQLNAMEPLITYNILNSIKIMAAAIDMLDQRCVRGITADERQCRRHLENSIAMVTALVPYIGYENAARIANTALNSSQTVSELVLQEELMEVSLLEEVLNPDRMLQSGQVRPAVL